MLFFFFGGEEVVSTAGRERTQCVEGAAPALPVKAAGICHLKVPLCCPPESSEGQGWVKRDIPGGLCAPNSPWERGIPQRELSLGVVLLEKKLRINSELVLRHFGGW